MAADNVVAPNVKPAVPLDTLLPTVKFSRSPVPIDKVPSVCVMPAPAASRSDAMVTVPLMVVLYAFTEDAVAKSRVPAFNANAFPADPQAAVLPSTSVPALNVVVPVYVFVPDNITIPLPDFVIPPAVPLKTLEIVN